MGKAFFIKSSTPQRALHNVQWMEKLGRSVSIYHAVDMPLDFRHVLIYEAGCEDTAREDPHWSEHDFKPVTKSELEFMVSQMIRREPMPVVGIIQRGDDAYLIDIKSQQAKAGTNG